MPGALNWDIDTHLPLFSSTPMCLFSPEDLQTHYRDCFELFKAGLKMSEYRYDHCFYKAEGLNQPSLLLLQLELRDEPTAWSGLSPGLLPRAAASYC